ncbi:MAG: transcription initiation factor IIB family protein [Euryarchaeota archaeon]|nr:transcription initiation factor IIB family protein [Euryarchaeota archaeon]
MVRDVASGELHCGDCGLVLGSQWIADDLPYSGADGPSEGGRGVGPFVPTGAPRRHLGSTLGVRRDGQGRALSADRRNYYGHLKWLMDREVTRRSDSPLDRSPARDLLARTSSTLGLPTVVLSESERIFRLASQRGAFRGRNLGSSVGASLYAACRRFGLPRTLGEVSKVVGVRRSELGRAFKALSRNLGTPVPIVNLQSYLARYAEELALSPKVRSTVEEMLRATQGHPEVSGLSPHGLVAALIYLASERHGESRARVQVARVGSITEVTLRSTSKTLERLLAAKALNTE